MGECSSAKYDSMFEKKTLNSPAAPFYIHRNSDLWDFKSQGKWLRSRSQIYWISEGPGSLFCDLGSATVF